MATKKRTAKKRSPGVTGGAYPDVPYSEALADRICEQLADGKSLRSICRQPGMPCKAAVFRWLARYEQFAKQYTAAREAQADAYFDEVVDISDNQRLDPQARRVMIDARKWAAGKMRPKLYGDSMKLMGDRENPVRVEFERIERVVVDPAAT